MRRRKGELGASPTGSGEATRRDRQDLKEAIRAAYTLRRLRALYIAAAVALLVAVFFVVGTRGKPSEPAPTIVVKPTVEVLPGGTVTIGPRPQPTPRVVVIVPGNGPTARPTPSKTPKPSPNPSPRPSPSPKPTCLVP